MRKHELLDAGILLPMTLFLAAALALAGCDQGTNGDGDDDDPTPAVPTLVQIGSNGDLRLAFTPSDTMRLHYELGGTWTIATDSMSVQGGLQADSGPARFGVFQLAISTATPIVRLPESHPTAGAWVMDAEQNHLVTTVNPDAGGPGVPGVIVEYTESGFPSGNASLAWRDLVDPAAGAPDWMEWASLGYMTLAVAAGHVGLALNDLAFALGNDDALVAAGAAGMTVTGDPFPGTGAAGEGIYRWVDVNNSGNLNPLDAFAFAHTDWWFPGPGPDAGLLLTGDWSLLNYIENTDPMISIGGALAFTGLDWRTARREGAVWSVDDPGLTVTGTGHLFVQEVP